MSTDIPITNAELDKIYQSQFPQPVEGATEDLLMTQRLDVLGTLITNEIMLQRAEKLGLAAIDADVDTEFNKMKAPYTEEEFNKQLAAQARLRRPESADSPPAHGGQADQQGNHLADRHHRRRRGQFLQRQQSQLQPGRAAGPPGADSGDPAPDPEVRNLKNNKAQNEAQAKSKIMELKRA